ncbi:MAG TPA: hypothetical protein VNV44_09840 [Solirubrobacteraceae bacterium]|jgi:hypothetical protein|nr:hypothetical protein [Solirubrobacteraceae bacterium]
MADRVDSATAISGEPGRRLRWLPLGYPIGAWNQTTDRDANQTAIVRNNARLVHVGFAQYDTWMRLRIEGDLARTLPQDGVAAPADVEALTALGLLLELPESPPEALSTLDGLILTACGIGAGNLPERPEQFVIVTHRFEFVAALDAVSYAVWARCGAGASLGAACRAAAAGSSLPIESVTGAVVRSLPAMVASGAVFAEHGGIADGP